MGRTFAFLRAINVGGHRVSMERLQELFKQLHLGNVETFIASGNVVFDGGSLKEAALRLRIEEHLQLSLGYEVTTFLRTDRELAALLESCPFDGAEVAAAGALNVALLHAPLAVDLETRLQALHTPMDAFRAAGREVWWLCQVKQSESTFSNAVLERTLGLKATFRGFNTLQRLAARHLKR